MQIDGEIRTRQYTPGSGENGGAKKSITEIRVRGVAKFDRSRNGQVVKEPETAA